MYSNILCAVDGSELSNKALHHAVALCEKTGATLIIVTVTDPSVLIAPGAEMLMIDTSSIMSELEQAKSEAARGILNEAKTLAQAAGITPKVVHVPETPAADGILRAAEQYGADVIAMGSHGRRGLGRILLGSQAAEVLAHAKTPVLVVK
ncbi:MAG: universal stress protein [Phyllobacteriaceae bacterium]|nr:universal stress protein [Phyllobacteriaceae bacterium]